MNGTRLSGKTSYARRNTLRYCALHPTPLRLRAYPNNCREPRCERDGS